MKNPLLFISMPDWANIFERMSVLPKQGLLEHPLYEVFLHFALSKHRLYPPASEQTFFLDFIK